MPLFKRFTCICFLMSCMAGMAQIPEMAPDGGGNWEGKTSRMADHMSKTQRDSIIAVLQENERQLRSTGKLRSTQDLAAVTLAWPLKQAPGYYDNNFYGITNYVDENPAYPDKLLDYNCGNRTYDLSNGYNHAGTDIITWPFPWQKMAQNSVQVVAGAAGTIIGKSDGNFDQNCSFCTQACTWNAVYIMHSDGSVAWYGHMKSGSLTSKGVGQTVALGEYLGVVGSSGNSTTPHLHLELYTNSSYTKLVDPWAGPCNNMNGNTSWWTNQQPYYVPALNKLMTHNAVPNASNCPAGEAVNEKQNFVSGQTIYLSSYYRDIQVGTQVVHSIFRPDKTLYLTWTQSFTTYYSLSWWWYSRTLPSPAMNGIWIYQVAFDNKKFVRPFSVNTAAVVVCPGGNTVLTANASASSYQWQVNTGSGFVNINNNAMYSGVLSSKLEMTGVPSSYYGYQYRCLIDGAPGAIVLTLKFTSYWNGNVSSAWEDPMNWSCGVPDANTDIEVSAGVPNYPVINSNAVCRGSYVNPAATLTVKPGWKLEVTGK